MGGFSLSSVPRPGEPLSLRRRPGRLFWRRVAFVPGHHVDLIGLNRAFQSHWREFGRDPAAQLFAHRLNVRDAQIQFLGDLLVRHVQAHEVQAQHPDPQRLVMSGQNGPGQIVEAGSAGRASVALPMPLRLIMAITGDRCAAAVRAADALRPTVLPHQREALRIVQQARQVHQ